MMYFASRKLSFAQVGLRETTRILLAEQLVTCSCYILCPPECQTSSEDDQSSLSPPPPPPPTSQKNNMPMLLILMLCILGAAFLCLCYVTILKRYRSNLSNSRRIFLSIFADASGEDFADDGPVVDHPIWYIQTAGLPQSVIDSIPVFKYKKGDGLLEGTDCSVCLSEFEDDESLRLLPKCSHAFHLTCIDTWLRSHKNCPLCRAPIVRDDINITTTIDTTPASPEQSALDSEDPRVDNQETDVENGGVGASEMRSEDENSSPLWDEQGKILARNNGIRVFSDLGDHRVKLGEELQSVRRSFSMDLSSASRTVAQVAKIEPVKEEGSSSLEMEELKKQNYSDIAAAKLGNKYYSSINRSKKSFSFGRSLQSVPIRMKRSFSSSSKSSFHRSGRSQELD